MSSTSSIAASLGLMAAVALLPWPAAAATFTVTTTGIGGAGSLAQAITDANATVDADTIQFNIAGGGVKTIGGDLPAITAPVTIDGTTQPGAVSNSVESGATNAVQRIVLDGAQVPSGGAVLEVDAGPVTIRGVAISGIKSQTAGIEVAEGVTGVVVRGCFVGTDAAGVADASAGTGIVVRGTATIGSELLPDRNLVSGNSTAGIVLRGPSSVVVGNLIGTTAGGAATLGNGRGVQVSGSAATGNVVGGSADKARNVIAGNSGDGILVSADAGSGNTLDGNLFAGNGGLAIDLGADGPTRNDATDADAGANGLLNTPEIGLARINGDKLTVRGVMRGKPGSYRIVVFLGPGPGPAGYGEAEAVATSAVASVGASPLRLSFSATLSQAPADGLWLTAVATSLADGSTSEFSRAVEAVQAGGEIEVTNASDSGPGTLRAAIAEASSDPNANTIVFDIPGPAPHVIPLASSLWISDTLALVDGYSQAGAAWNRELSGSDAVPGVVLDGAGIASGPVLGASQASVILRGLAVVNGPASGIELSRAASSVVEGCFSGVGPARDLGEGNAHFGVHDNEGLGVRIGGPFVGDRNLLCGNDGAGIRLFGDGTQVLNNIVGTASLPNGVVGIAVNGQDLVIGGDHPDFQNLIVGNAEEGIVVGSDSAGIEIRGNAIYDNGGLGIDLADSIQVVNPNDPDDADGGANGRQNFPELGQVLLEDGLLSVSGTLDVPPDRVNSAYRLRLYRNETCDPSGHGEGEELVAATDVFIGSDEAFQVLVPTGISQSWITATITDPVTGNTSEYSACSSMAVAVDCGDANIDEKVTAADALVTLKAAVGTAACADCVCDVNRSGSTTSTDALFVLRHAVGQAVVLDCEPCF